MLDWLDLLWNAFWIFALAWALAVVSRASWRASEQRTRFRDEIARPAPRLALNLAGALFCAGLALTSTRAWETAVWAVLALLFLIQAVLPRPRGAG